MLEGKTDQRILRKLLKRWLKQKAESVLPAWLERTSRETGITYKGCSIRSQRTRWGSCSSRGTISLNQKLLFLDPALVRYVLVHELCHIVQAGHGNKFWALVEHHQPGARELRKRLREVAREIPDWG
jgi:predicted metal-dependent hydrolase